MKIHIQEAWWSAWQKFGWAKGIWGVGLDVKKIEKAIDNKEELEITVGKSKEVYKVSPTTVKNYAERNGCKYTARGNTKLYVIPQTELKKK